MITSGIAAILDYTHNDFPRRIVEQIQAAYHHYQELQLQQYGIGRYPDYEPYGLVGRSQSLHKVLYQARRAASVSDAPVLIIGESGTGKQRIAEFIHQMDVKRNKKPFVSVNCAAITGSLAESELFGHKKGAFTGATEDRLGYFRAANGGSILLDEISELPLPLQPKILRVLQEGLVLPVGCDKESLLDVRVMAATNRDLDKMVCNNAFRLD
ncbi:MAG TPA: sigma-54 factor interaction domain-containing protein, partial [Anaerohalosphaeraceae bacterium]|nr:sigma-54 factor interaction domain-containing protein [Anaerohalosphaeraceae bacterium]